MAKLLRLVMSLTVAVTLQQTAVSQSLSVNTTGNPADASAILDVSSTLKGVLIPRMDKTQKNAIATPATGLLIYQTLPDSAGFHYYDGTQWVWLSNNSPLVDTINWKTHGNLGLTDSTSFFGNIDNVPLNFRQNNAKAGRIDNIRSNVFLGTLAGNDTAVGQVNIGAFAGQKFKTNFSGVNIGYGAGQNITGANNNNIGIFAGQGSAGSTGGDYNNYMGSSAGQFNKTGQANVGIGHGALSNDTSGTLNTAVGYSTLNLTGNGSNNTAIGGYALSVHKEGNLNTAIGYEAMQLDSAGAVNVAVGWRALRNNKVGAENTAVGVGALEADSSGNWNTAVGRYSGFLNKRGNYNTSMGMQSALSGDTASLTTFIGSFSGYYNKSDYNTGLGTYALTYNNFTTGSNLTGTENTGVGYGAGYLVNLGSKNTAVGHQSMRGVSSYISGNRNVAVGDSAMTYLTTGSDNVAVGVQALSRNTNAYGNVAVGGSALRNNTTSLRNTAVGDSALYTQSYDPGGNYFSDNTAIGSKAMIYTQPISTGTGTKNTAVGSEAMYFNTTGNQNTAIGVSALRENTTGTGNTVVGRSANRLSKTGDYNSYYGYASGYSDSSGSHNIAIGYESSYLNDTASFTIGIGTQALYNNTIDSNVAIGFRAGYYANIFPANPSKEQTFLGTYAGFGSFVSSKNTAIGFRALAQTNAAGTSTDYSNGGRNTVIGDSAMAGGMGAYNVAVGAEVMSRSGLATFRNVAIGDSAMGNSVSPADNVAVGYKSLLNVATTLGNTATGAYSARSLTSGYWNTINGLVALENATTAAGNTAIGVSSFRSNVTGFDNVGVGINSGFNVTSSANTFLGSYAGEGTSGFSTGGSNTGVGYLALNDIRSGSLNVAVGLNALRADTSGDANVAIGPNAMFTNLASDYNTAVGNSALYMHKRVGNTYNTAVGASSLEQDSSGYYNTGMGTSTFRNNKTGILNTGVGINAGYHQKESYNTFIGGYSGVGERANGNYAADTGNYNAGLGALSLYRIANGSNNVALGYSAMYSDSSGNLNTAVGNGALYSNTRSHNNQAFGWNALYSYNNIAEGWNNAFGDRAAESLTSGTQNVVMGSWAFLGHASGSLNTVVGNSSMGNGAGLGGSNNTALGNGSLYNTRADGNTAVGNNAGDGNTTGTFNTLVGYNADVTSSNFTNATAIGYNATVAQSNSIVLGNTSVDVGVGLSSPLTKFHIYEPASANVNLRVGSLSGAFEPGLELTKGSGGADWKIFNSTGNLFTLSRATDDFVAAPTDYYEWGVTAYRPSIDITNSLGLSTQKWTTVYASNGTINTSDGRDKENISDLNYGLKEIMKLRPVSYTWKENPQWGKKIGFIAQEVQPILGEVVQVGDLKSKTPSKDTDDKAANANSDKLGIYYSDIIPVTVKAIQEQQQIIEQQQKQIDDLKKKNEQLEKDMQAIKTKLGINN